MKVRKMEVIEPSLILFSSSKIMDQNSLKSWSY